MTEPTRIHDLPLPLRLRNSLVKAGFATDADILAWHAAGGSTIDGIGDTGRNQLIGWLIREEAKLSPNAERAEDYRRDDTFVAPGRWNQLTADTSMRGGLESLSTVTSATAKSADEHDPYWTPARPAPTKAAPRTAQNHQWDAPESYEAELAARLTTMRSAIAKAGGETVISTSKDALSLTLESEILKRLDDLIPVISSLPHAREFGITVDRKIVARMAMIRGLDALERAHNGGKEAQKAENAPSEAENTPVSAAEPPSGVHATPEGWTKCGPTDKIPVAQAVIHDYYTQNNWFRYWGKAGDSVIYFYWSPEVQFQDLDVFPGTDKNGKTVAVQETPWGPGHIVPINWANQ